MLKTILFIVFTLASLLVCTKTVYHVLGRNAGPKKGRWLLSPIQLTTVGVFFSVALIFAPIYYTSYDLGDPIAVIRPFLLSVHNALRLFILDGDFDVITASVVDQWIGLRVVFSLYAAVLYVVAPVLTFGNVLSIFKNLNDELRYSRCKSQPLYIFSALNRKSIALARSVQQVKAAEKPVIVFAGISQLDEENEDPLLEEARGLNAICLRKEISQLDIYSKAGKTELFLMDEDEAENVRQAVSITTELNCRNQKQNVKVFVFAQSASSAYVIDSLNYENLLEHAQERDYDGETFKLRRVEEKHQLVLNTLPNMKLFDLADQNDKVLSVMLLGMGSYGMEFFKALIWYCQVEGYKLEINVVDKEPIGASGMSRTEATIRRQCPELLNTNCSAVDGEAFYDIRLFPGVDASLADLDALLIYDGDDPEQLQRVQRLKRTNLAIVTLGDDDLNIEVAVHLRSLFDRLNKVRAKSTIRLEEEPVQIYAVVYDDMKSGLLHCKDKNATAADFLIDHKAVPYHIHFIGGMSQQFAYNNIYDEALEDAAYRQHVGWVSVEQKIHDEWTQAKDAENLEKHDFYSLAYDENKEGPKEKMKFERFEYFRRSSIAKELRFRAVRENPQLSGLFDCLEGEDRQTCKCANCVRRKRSEHMRWNAYTRTVGFSYHPTRADRAKLHNDLRGWEFISELERQKD